MPDLQDLVTAQAKLAAQTTEQLVRQILALWAALTPSDWWNDDLVAGNAAKSSSLVEAALTQVRMHQRSFTRQVFNEMSIGVTPPPANTGYARANTNGFEVYRRPATEFRFLQSRGLSFDEAHERAKTRVQKIGQADLVRARMDESGSLYAANPQVIGTRRIIHPERSESGTCGLCLVAATQFYSVTDLQPIHDEERCTTLPIKKDSDPGLKLNKQDLQEIYNAAGSSAAADLLNTRVTVHEHGELGPILVKHGDHFRTPEEAGRPKFERLTPEMVRSARTAEREAITSALATAQSNYDELLKTQERGQGEALGQFRAIKNMKDRIGEIDRFLAQ